MARTYTVQLFKLFFYLQRYIGKHGILFTAYVTPSQATDLDAIYNAYQHDFANKMPPEQP